MPEKRVTVYVLKPNDRPHFILQWVDPDTGKRKSRSAETADRELAEQGRADLEYELNHGRYQEVSRMTWETFRERFEEEYLSSVRENTRANYAATFDLFEDLCNPGRLRSITERTVSAFLSGMRRRPTRGKPGMEPSTIKVRLQFLHTALAWATDQKLIPQCPGFPAVKVLRRKPQPIPAESFERLLAKSPGPEMTAFLLCGWLGGLRLTEALGLEWGESRESPWLDLPRNRIWLPAGSGKSGEDAWVPIDPALRAALEVLPHHGRKVFRFLSRKTGDRICSAGMSRRIVSLAQRAGVKLTMHSLRKGFGCRYAGKVPAQVLQKLMRHSNIAITMDYYANVDAAVEEAVMGQLPNTSPNRRHSADAEHAGHLPNVRQKND